jgi:hypothetical protein
MIHQLNIKALIVVRPFHNLIGKKFGKHFLEQNQHKTTILKE